MTTDATEPGDIPHGGISGIEVIRRACHDMPSTPGVYRMLDAKGAVLYVGKARQLKSRVLHYTQAMSLPYRLQRMVMATHAVEITLAASEAEALLLEASLVKALQPRYNILLKDDKSFPYIQISAHPFPRIGKYRGARKEKGEYFGPFVSAGAVEHAIALLQKAFLLRSCSDNVFKNRTRPCMQYQIKRCSAPCVAYVDQAQYAELVRQAERFLSGRGSEIQEQLGREMHDAAQSMEFERAGVLRDRLRALALVQSQSAAVPERDTDVFACADGPGAVCVQLVSWRSGQHRGGRAYFPAHAEQQEPGEVLAAFVAQYYQTQILPAHLLLSHAPADMEVLEAALSLLAGRRVHVKTPARGSGRQAVEMALRNAREALRTRLSDHARHEETLAGVAAVFGLNAPPRRVEVYDNSHISGTSAVGAMIVAGPEGFDKKSYRLFNIRFTEMAPGDDYAMMREMLTRRFRRLLVQEEAAQPQPPDLVLIDGGAGHLAAAQQVFAELGIGDIACAAIAKGKDRNAGREWFHMEGREPFQLPVNTPVLHYLQTLRDEAHRFAIGAHRKRRSTSTHASALDEVDAIGPARKRALLQHFGSARGVANATVEDLMRVPGLSRALAQKIHAHFH
ncbi:MAG: excinuclease ABC subunit UvrC [Alphaproteobacteria bacterium]|nr:excinuclease ABC subunit UvrC [Alphaproteobacteria bacterium]